MVQSGEGIWKPVVDRIKRTIRDSTVEVLLSHKIEIVGARCKVAKAEGAQVEEDQPKRKTRLDPNIKEFVAPTLEKMMQICHSKVMGRMEIGHLGVGEKKCGFIMAYQKGWFLEMATPTTWVYTDKAQKILTNDIPSPRWSKRVPTNGGGADWRLWREEAESGWDGRGEL
ncbi:hypothetical protein F511_31401 [Dorcoceras hygrometricum]|uniref:Uncharacterized protein n=1 Tax=Dorcoceras hygrometricum TaxID=472368 RepID=A0A2Z7BAX2_9LAMI|nr:hypothetical protein F511_31401 [Dorcoceras hygrometricum]